MRKFDNAADAYVWVKNHPSLVLDDAFEPWVEVVPVLVDPTTKRIEDNPKRNTDVNWWVEAGPYTMEEHGMVSVHDYDLDCGGDTADEAIVNLAKKILRKYGDYPNA